MSKREIIKIDRDKCNGCGLCTEACVEGALALDDENKAVLVNEIYCDGLGACLDVCPTGALKVVEKEGKDYNPQAAYNHVLNTRGRQAATKIHGLEQISLQQSLDANSCQHTACPGSRVQEIRRPASRTVSHEEEASELSQWPIQLHLISPLAPYFNNSDLLIAADCTAYALGGFHSKLLKGKKLVIACPKLDDTRTYVPKLADILKNNTIYSLTVAIMSVPCCRGLYRMVEEAVAMSGSKIHIKKIVVGIDGETVEAAA
ncbi:MAG: 4Fe-4S dicluster domain-containing protein [Candidatus Aminicenantes bacterium]|nr:4Fe-4S dicluster domain-containing protein [Candidatus Aminicenantes bacterium]